MDSAAVSTSVPKDKTSEYKWTNNSFPYQNLMSVHTNDMVSVAGNRMAALRDYFGRTDSYSIYVHVRGKIHGG